MKIKREILRFFDNEVLNREFLRCGISKGFFDSISILKVFFDS